MLRFDPASLGAARSAHTESGYKRASSTNPIWWEMMSGLLICYRNKIKEKKSIADKITLIYCGKNHKMTQIYYRKITELNSYSMYYNVVKPHWEIVLVTIQFWRTNNFIDITEPKSYLLFLNIHRMNYFDMFWILP